SLPAAERRTRQARGEGRGMKFAYKAFDRGGQAKSDVIEAASQAEASEALRRQGLFVSEVKPAGDGPSAGGGGRAKGKARRGGVKNVAAFMRHLSVLVTTGTPLVEALAALERQTTDEGWRAVIADVRSRVEDGAPFSEALAAYPRCFDT